MSKHTQFTEIDYDAPAVLDDARSDRAEIQRLRSALTDMLSGWRYIRQHHGDLYGVGWDRCEQAAIEALGGDTR